MPSTPIDISLVLEPSTISTQSRHPLSGSGPFDVSISKHSALTYFLRHSSNDSYNFITIPPREQNRAMVTRFLHQVNMHAKRSTCIVCSQDCQTSVAKTLNLCDIPGQQLLKPDPSMAEHGLGDAMVLDAPVVTWDTQAAAFGAVCNPCYTSLLYDEQPAMSLASGYWIGAHPPQLADLSIAEKMLLSRRLPGVYVLFESKHELARDLDVTLGVHNDTNDDSPPGIQNTLPMTPTQLTSLIRMPISGVKLENAPECMRVRRKLVERALRFLKKNHPFYEDVEISGYNLDLFPESAVPMEVMEHMCSGQPSEVSLSKSVSIISDFQSNHDCRSVPSPHSCLLRSPL